MRTVRKYLFILFAACVGASLLVSFHLLNIPELRILKTIRHDAISYDSRSKDPALSSPKLFVENESSPVKSLSIDFRLKVYSIGSWNNVFQTADSNDGMRMELTAPSLMALLVGHATSLRKSDERTYGVMEKFNLNEWYLMHINVDRYHLVTASVDGKPVLHQILNSTDSSPIDFDIARMAVGTGYNASRPLAGALDNFSVEYALWAPNETYAEIQDVLAALLCLLGIVLLVAYRYEVSSFFTTFFKSRLSRENKIDYLILIMTIGFIAAMAFHCVRGMFWNDTYPLNSFLPDPQFRFGDFHAAIDQWRQYSFDGVGFGLTYFPATYLLVDLITKLGPFYMDVVICLTLFCLFLAVYVYINIHTTNRIVSLQNTAICAFTSYPFLITYLTGNMEMFVFIFLALFVYFYQQRTFALSRPFLAMAVGMKLFPMVFMVLLISDKRYKEVFYTFLWLIVLSLLPLLIFRGGVQHGVRPFLDHFLASEHLYKVTMIDTLTGVYFGNSLLGLFRIIAGFHCPPIQRVLFPYFIFTVFCFGLLSFYVVVYEKEFWKKVAILVIAMDVLPYVSADYKLMHIFIPLFLFINARKGEMFDIPYVIAFALLFIPKDFCYFREMPLFTLNTVLNPLLMLFIVMLIIFSTISAQRKIAIVKE